ncbi:unnamed protein product [Brachionus calyciflorus]|uniref:DUF4419 domain-containing protein n=1 Tax=Brachionus calyciflorus TaxID=104777 RepID=A0A813TI73_9BILA|nr:unnamed protein product [Brachionus calyciflorus]
MKIIKPNDIKVETYKNLDKSLTTAHNAVKNMVRLSEEHIQYVKSEIDGDLLKCNMHPFVEAVHQAYSRHLPLIISPDMIWYLISSATAAHITLNSEELRYKFVDHDGKKKIEIRRDDFVLNSKSNPWHEVIDDFSSKIRELTKNEIADTLVANFSTTSKDSRVVSQIVLMDAMKNYFDYHMSTMCGIPEFRITGEKEDWENVRDKTLKIIDLIPEFNKWYNNGLSEILQQFIDVFNDKIDNGFWNEIYKVGGGSGGPYISGWILALFPYLDNQRKNGYAWETSWRDVKGFFAGITTKSFDYHMNQVPFKWNYLGQEIDMLFIGGLIGVVVQKDQALKPVFGYSVAKAN